MALFFECTAVVCSKSADTADIVRGTRFIATYLGEPPNKVCRKQRSRLGEAASHSSCERFTA